MIIFLLILFCTNNSSLGSDANETSTLTFRNDSCGFLTESDIIQVRNDFITPSLIINHLWLTQKELEGLVKDDVNSRISELRKKTLLTANLLPHLLNRSNLYLIKPSILTVNIIIEKLQDSTELSGFLKHIFDEMFNKCLISFIPQNLNENRLPDDFTTQIKNLTQENEFLNEQIILMNKHYSALESTLNETEREFYLLLTNNQQLKTDYLTLQTDYCTLETYYRQLLKKYNTLVLNSLGNKK